MNLTITLQQAIYLESVQNLVEETIPNVRSQIHGPKCVTIMLPQEERDLFISLIEILEKKSTEFGINTIDIGVSMEAVYLE